MLHIHEVKQNLQQLDEQDAKSLLLMIYAKLDSALVEDNCYVMVQTVEEILSIYHKLPYKLLN